MQSGGSQAAGGDRAGRSAVAAESGGPHSGVTLGQRVGADVAIGEDVVERHGQVGGRLADGQAPAVGRTGVATLDAVAASPTFGRVAGHRTVGQVQVEILAGQAAPGDQTALPAQRIGERGADDGGKEGRAGATSGTAGAEAAITADRGVAGDRAIVDRRAGGADRRQVDGPAEGRAAGAAGTALLAVGAGRRVAAERTGINGHVGGARLIEHGQGTSAGTLTLVGVSDQGGDSGETVEGYSRAVAARAGGNAFAARGAGHLVAAEGTVRDGDRLRLAVAVVHLNEVRNGAAPGRSAITARTGEDGRGGRTHERANRGAVQDLAGIGDVDVDRRVVVVADGAAIAADAGDDRIAREGVVEEGEVLIIAGGGNGAAVDGRTVAPQTALSPGHGWGLQKGRIGPHDGKDAAGESGDRSAGPAGPARSAGHGVGRASRGRAEGARRHAQVAGQIGDGAAQGVRGGQGRVGGEQGDGEIGDGDGRLGQGHRREAVAAIAAVARMANGVVGVGLSAQSGRAAGTAVASGERNGRIIGEGTAEDRPHGQVAALVHDGAALGGAVVAAEAAVAAVAAMTARRGRIAAIAARAARAAGTGERLVARERHSVQGERSALGEQAAAEGVAAHAAVAALTAVAARGSTGRVAAIAAIAAVAPGSLIARDRNPACGRSLEGQVAGVENTASGTPTAIGARLTIGPVGSRVLRRKTIDAAGPGDGSFVAALGDVVRDLAGVALTVQPDGHGAGRVVIDAAARAHAGQPAVGKTRGVLAKARGRIARDGGAEKGQCFALGVEDAAPKAVRRAERAKDRALADNVVEKGQGAAIEDVAALVAKGLGLVHGAVAAGDGQSGNAHHRRVRLDVEDARRDASDSQDVGARPGDGRAGRDFQLLAEGEADGAFQTRSERDSAAGVEVGLIDTVTQIAGQAHTHTRAVRAAASVGQHVDDIGVRGKQGPVFQGLQEALPIVRFLVRAAGTGRETTPLPPREEGHDDSRVDDS